VILYLVFFKLRCRWAS